MVMGIGVVLFNFVVGWIVVVVGYDVVFMLLGVFVGVGFFLYLVVMLEIVDLDVWVWLWLIFGGK